MTNSSLLRVVRRAVLLLLLLLWSGGSAVVIATSSSSPLASSARSKAKSQSSSSSLLKGKHGTTRTTKQLHHRTTTRTAAKLGGLSGGATATATIDNKPPSMYWAMLHNWMYFLSLGFNAINIQFLVREIIDGDPKATPPSAQAIALSGRVESVDKLLTFCGVAYLSALSDKWGRKPLMAWSALGFMLTNLLQAQTKSSIACLYLADFVDGCSSCMAPLCQAYITDVSAPEKLAANLGIFQGISAGGAFIFAFPIGGILGAKYGPRVPLYLAAAIQFINAMIILFITPESNTDRDGVQLNLTQDNPIGGLVRLFGRARLLRIASCVYFLVNLAKASLDAQFTNYSNIRFGWTQAQSGPVLVMVGFMLAIAPRVFVPLLGLKNAILSGLLIFAAGLTGCGLVPTSAQFVWCIFVVSIGTMCSPALTALLANLAPAHERGALLGAAGSLNELTGAIGSTLYAGILAQFTSENPPIANLPGMHFLVGAGVLVVAWLIALPGFLTDKDHPAFQSNREELKEHMPQIDA